MGKLLWDQRSGRFIAPIRVTNAMRALAVTISKRTRGREIDERNLKIMNLTYFHPERREIVGDKNNNTAKSPTLQNRKVGVRPHAHLSTSQTEQCSY